MTDLLGELDNDEVVDLLDGIEEEAEGSAWNPVKDEDAPRGIQGKVLSLGSVRSTHPPYPDCPIVTIEASDGAKWRVTGYQSVLRKEIEEKDVRVGDLFAVKYFGKKMTAKGDGEYHHFKVATRAGQRRPAADAGGKPIPF